MVAGIIAGDGSVAGATGGKDTAGYYNGTGIAPGAKIFSYKIFGSLTDIGNQQVALNYSRNRMEAGFADRAFIANNSWNERDTAAGTFLPFAQYDAVAQFYDNRALDANTSLAGAQPMMLVFSAGNDAFNCSTNAIGWDSVSSPAVAKNVISVGATESYRPAPDPPLACRGCRNTNGVLNGRPPDEDATNFNLIATFSGRGRYFSPYPSTAMAHNTRVKPDLVAPGVRVFSTVPYNYSAYDNPNSTPTGCVKYYPTPTTTYHTYGSGTSFAAPVVSAAAAIARKWFLDRGISPSPSLIKGALIATADDLGGFAGNDHRPSPAYGWGRVSLDRLTDSIPKKAIPASTSNQVGLGQSITYPLTVSSSSAPILVVVVWDDPASNLQTDSSAPLTNDLVLDVGDGAYRGNFFDENMTGTDDGWSYHFGLGTAANDTVNNVEAVFLPAGTYAQGAVVRVKVTGVNNISQQSFSVYAYNLF